MIVTTKVYKTYAANCYIMKFTLFSGNQGIFTPKCKTEQPSEFIEIRSKVMANLF